jgi:CelD/BcsL family acetyltransferase involved in cellulose biosynthesis
MNFFSSAAFLEAVAEAHHRGSTWRLADVEVAGRYYRTLLVGRGRVVGDVPFMDFLEPLHEVPETRAWPTRRLARACRGVIDAATCLGRPRQAEMPAPFVDWSQFATWDEFVTHAQERAAPAFRFTANKRRKLERAFGPLRFVEAHDDGALLATVMTWKAQQYRRTGFENLFAVAANVALFRSLQRRRALAVTALYAGDRLAAAHVGAVHAARFYYWLPAHDVELQRFSPGTLLLEYMLHDSHARGQREFDLLLGDEPYKWTYATHARLVGEVGVAPWSERAWRAARPWVATQLKRQPQLFA